jgi:hypothetical protein
MRPLEKLVSLAALSVIVAGAAYAYNRERLASSDLNPVFQDINREYFNGELSGVRVEWRTLDGKIGEARKLGDGEYLIFVDRRENTSFADVNDTLRHEACHVYVDWKEKEKHGPMFRACATRFEQQNQARREATPGNSPLRIASPNKSQFLLAVAGSKTVNDREKSNNFGSGSTPN